MVCTYALFSVCREGAVSISKIVVTGGPCGGKTTALSRIQRDLSHLGYTVLIVPETATSLISGGVAPWTCGSNLEYQKCQMQLQLQKEEIFERAAASMPRDKILIVCDRGAMDNRVYMDDEEFASTIDWLGKSKAELRDGYDAVFHLVTAAKGAEEFYSLENNSARTESAEEAARMDERFIAAWTGHPHLRIIDNSCDFEGKMRNLIREITYFLGELAPYEIERKFLVRYPNIDWLESLPNCEHVEIVQHYLRSEPSEEIRIRRRTSGETSLYYLTQKNIVGQRRSMRTQRRLTKGEYHMMATQIDPQRRAIHKTRYCLTYENQYLEIDVYPCWSDQAIVEIELSQEDAPVALPPELSVIREITDDPRYRNAAIAARPAGATH